MSADQALFFLHEMVWTALIVGAPLLGATMIVGLLISVVQVATQIQEITLSYVPKLLAAALILLVLGGWMLGKLNQFAISLYNTIPSLGG
ncbi:flagellar biosynthetic protein FliQ [Vitreimonas flagellata]|jgi:flagellar biosynthetic protein FliQ|uniref:flagellar biosynthetic protein FliQ n=1 Tax=Vitreimonas flagellata TaxID=2560861 RepID=UPI001074BCC6|nr:flagellar biosynthetic protein FliQ [Vitreimonas flagellata]